MTKMMTFLAAFTVVIIGIGIMGIMGNMRFLERRLTTLESIPTSSDESREFSAHRLDGMVRQWCKYERRDDKTGVLTCVYKKEVK